MNIDLQCGDCLQLMQAIPDGSVDMVLCDLPYGVLNRGNHSAKWDCQIDIGILWKEYSRVCKPNAAVVLFGQGMFTADLMKSNAKDWRYNLVWKKGERTTGFLNANRQPLRNHEDIIVFYKKQPEFTPQMEYAGLHAVNHGRGNLQKPTVNNCYGDFKQIPVRKSEFKFPKSVITVQPEHKEFYHPTQKPVKLLEYLIKTYSHEGETVLDNCMGSGTTGVAAVNTGRNFIGMELNPEYWQIAEARIAEALQKANGIPQKSAKTKGGQMDVFDLLEENE